MSCTICQTSFSFFTREVACPGCGFSCCSKCLKYKCDVPAKGVKKVCGRCYNKYKSAVRSENNSIVDINIKMQDDSEHEEPLAPVDITKKLDSLENPAKPPIVMYKHTNHWDKFKKGLEPADQEIVERLRKLKEEDKNAPLPSVDEIGRRLALLKDEDPDANGSNHRVNIHQADTRTDEQKRNDLIQEYFEQLELSSKNDPAAEIESRLRALQGRSEESGQQYSSHGKSSRDVFDDDENVTKKLISAAIAEAALEAKYEANVDEVVDPEGDMDLEAGKHSDDDEKPSCVMCEQTANLERCLGCHGDLYCAACFEDNHDDFELHKHKRVPMTKQLSSD